MKSNRILHWFAARLVAEVQEPHFTRSPTKISVGMKISTKFKFQLLFLFENAKLSVIKWNRYQNTHKNC